MEIVAVNNFNTSLAATASSTTTSLTLANAAGLPTLDTDQMMPLTLNDAATGTIFEIVYVTAISGAVLTVLRGQEGTTAVSWNIGDKAYCGPTAGTVAMLNGLVSPTASATLGKGNILTVLPGTLSAAITLTLPDNVPPGADYRMFGGNYHVTYSTGYEVPAAPVLSSVSGGTLAATTYYAAWTMVANGIETLPSPQASLAVAADFLLTAQAPATAPFADAYFNLYVGTSATTLTLQVSDVVPGGLWTEPTAGLVSGVAPPTTQNGYMLLEDGGSVLSVVLSNEQNMQATWNGLNWNTRFVRAGSSSAVDTSTTVNSLVLDAYPPIVSWVNQQRLRFQAKNTNTAAVTALVNGLAGVDVYSPAGALAGGEIVADGLYDVIYEASIPALVIVGQTAGIVTTPNAPLLTGNAQAVIIGTRASNNPTLSGTAVGYGATGTGPGYVAIGNSTNAGAGNYGVAIGHIAVAGGAGGVAVGNQAGSAKGGDDNTSVGDAAGFGIGTGGYNTCLGASTYFNGPSGLSYVTALGYNATPTAGNQTVIGSSGNNKYNLVYGGAFQTYNLPNNLTTVGAFTLTSPYDQPDVIVTATQTAAFTVTTDTAANLFAAAGSPPADFGYKFRIVNNDQSTTGYAMTIAAGTGVTISGPPNPAIPQGGVADYVLTFTSSTAATLTRVGTTAGTNQYMPSGAPNAASNSQTLAGTTAGSIDSSMPDQGVAKKFVAVAIGYENDTTTNQTITFPVAFVNTPAVTTNTTGLTVTATTTTLTITAPDVTTTYSGVLVVEGI
jgi:hypothetical protein